MRSNKGMKLGRRGLLPCRGLERVLAAPQLML